jgi:hypothetical protein
MTYFQLVLTPDGSGFYLNRRASDGIDLVSIANGHVAASYVVAPNLGAPKGRSEFTYEIGGDAVVGHANDGSAVLSYWSDSKAIAYAVVWNPKTGKSVTIATTPAYVDQRGTNFCQGRQFIMAGRTDPVRVISTPLFMEAFPTQTYQMRWFGPDGSETRKVDLKTTVAPHGLSAVTPDGSLAFFSEQYGRSVIAIDLATGTQVGELDLAENTGSAELVATADGVRLLVAGFKWIGVRDIQRKAWTAFLQPPPTYYGARAITSPTPSRAAAVFQGNGKTKGAFTFVTAIWDIPPPAPSQGATP